MILYNVTVSIDDSVHDEWVEWMKEVHIPDVMNTGKFIEYKFNKVLSGDEEGGQTYAIQYLAPDEKAFHEYEAHHAPTLQEEHRRKFEGKFQAFRTLMRVIDRSDAISG
jgi:predicted dinucleotide-binding enzyme